MRATSKEAQLLPPAVLQLNHFSAALLVLQGFSAASSPFVATVEGKNSLPLFQA
jgi:hypothetical protein